MTQKRGPYASPRQQDRRQRILHAAKSELETHGLAAATMQRIASSSGVSTKTLYNLFDNRELLFLEAASDLLVDMESDAAVVAAPEGIDRLLAFRLAGIARFRHSPALGREIISVVMRLDRDAAAANARFGPMQRFATQCLAQAETQGELQPGLDLEELGYLIGASQWGLALLWEKGALDLDRLELHVELNHCMTLATLCCGTRQQKLHETLERLTQGLRQPPSSRAAHTEPSDAASIDPPRET